MSEWKGPRKCERCGEIYVDPSATTAFDCGAILKRDSKVVRCDGKLVPYDRRAPSLLPLVRELREAMLPGNLLRKFAHMLLVRGDIGNDAEMLSTLVLRNMAELADDVIPRADAALAGEPQGPSRYHKRLPIPVTVDAVAWAEYAIALEEKVKRYIGKARHWLAGCRMLDYSDKARSPASEPPR